MQRLLVALVLAPLALTACEREFNPDVNNVQTNNGATNNGVGALGNIGAACDNDSNCNVGLVCDGGTCEAPGDVAEGQPCYRSAECGEGLFCENVSTVCLPAGDAGLGDACGSTAACEKGLVCAPAGFSGQCIQPGENDLGEACEGYFDCLAGLGCVGNPLDPDAPTTCQAGHAGLPLPWGGVECAESEADNFRPYFEVPDGDVTEFYRLPFPNDIRLENGHPNLDGHPSPGDGILGYDIVQRYKERIESEQDHFGLNSWTLMRMSSRVDFDSLTASGDTASVYAVVLSPDHPRYGQRTGISFRANTGGNKYICQNWIAAKPRPMEPDTTYAVILSTGVRSDAGVAASQDDDFAAMLGTSSPGGGAIGDAWTAYQPLRDWISADGIDANSIAVAAVFTTGNPIAEAQALAAPARATTPTASELTLCEEGVTSPCDDGLDGDDHQRGCFGTPDGYAEIHGKLSLPIFQEGTAPYLEDGGAVSTSEQRREDVCMAMTVPDATMPAEGWPVVVYAHGTGGSFRTHVGNGVLDVINDISIDGQNVRFLTIGWDQVQHGMRRNGDETHPNELVFNYANPDAAKGNFLQGAAETHAVMEYVANLTIDAANSPTGEEIRVNPDQIYFYGHSQGGTTGPLALPFDPTSKGAVLSGAGAGLFHAILGKTTPVNSPQAVAAVLAECGVQGCPQLESTHPVINLLQAFFDPVDPINFAHLIGAEAIDGVTYRHHVFHTNGLNDTYSPNPGLDEMARKLRATYILPFPGGEIDGVPSTSAPFGSNIVIDDLLYSVLGRQYEPADYDGHFVAFRNAEAQGDIGEFLGTAVTSGVPEVR